MRRLDNIVEGHITIERLETEMSTQNFIFVIDTNKKALSPCHPAKARKLLKKGKAAVYRTYPFTIILKYAVDDASPQPLQFKVDPGAKRSGIVIVQENEGGLKVVWAAELEHRGQAIKQGLDKRRALRRGRRSRKTRYRKPRFDNRVRPKGWLPPSLQSRVDNIETWLHRLSRYCPIISISMESVRFDTQMMENPEISGVMYQQGELAGYEVREYLLEKWGRQCAYCGVKDIPLQVEHIVSKANQGTDRVSNLCIACGPCNQKKGSRNADEFGYPEIQAQAKMSMKDIAAVNATRWKLYQVLKTVGFPLEVGTGGRTKYNRIQQGYDKAHWVDAACVGKSGQHVSLTPDHKPLQIKAMGHGTRQMCQTNKYGNAIRHRTKNRTWQGWRTGDMAKAIIPKGKYAGTYPVGRVTAKQSNSFKFSVPPISPFSVHCKYLTRIHQKDGYGYI